MRIRLGGWVCRALVGVAKWACSQRTAQVAHVEPSSPVDAAAVRRILRLMMFFADPCPYALDGICDNPQTCPTGDYVDCGVVMPTVNGTLPDAIGSLSCASSIDRVYARPLAGAGRVCTLRGCTQTFPAPCP